MEPLPFKPKAMWVVVQPDPEKKISAGGVAIPDKFIVKTTQGAILGMGDGYRTDTGYWKKPEGLNIGDRVCWENSVAREVTVGESVYTFIPANSIILVENPPVPVSEK